MSVENTIRKERAGNTLNLAIGSKIKIPVRLLTAVNIRGNKLVKYSKMVSIYYVTSIFYLSNERH